MYGYFFLRLLFYSLFCYRGRFGRVTTVIWLLAFVLMIEFTVWSRPRQKQKVRINNGKITDLTLLFQNLQKGIIIILVGASGYMIHFIENFSFTNINYINLTSWVSSFIDPIGYFLEAYNNIIRLSHNWKIFKANFERNLVIFLKNSKKNVNAKYIFENLNTNVFF